MSGGVVAANENEQMSAFIVRGCYKIEKEDATKMIKDCGLFCENVLAELPEAIQNAVLKNAASFLLLIVVGIDEVERQSLASSGTALPPVLPHHLVHLRNFEFNAFLKEQSGRLTEERLEQIQVQHRELLLSYRDDEDIRKAIDSSKEDPSFEGSWKCMSRIQCSALKEFCGGMATIFPGTATVESDFSDVNYEKDQYRAALTDMSLEGILHAKQHALVLSFMQS